MADANAARRWADALMSLATDANAEEAVQRDLEEVTEALTGEGGQLLRVLSSPVFGTAERKAVLDRVLQRIGVQPVTASFLKLQIDRGRIGLLPEVLLRYRQVVDERAGRLRVSVTTVDPLTPELERELQAAFAKATGKQIVLDAKIDKSLIGGLVARIGGRVYDASLRTRLEHLKHRLIHAQVLPEA